MDECPNCGNKTEKPKNFCSKCAYEFENKENKSFNKNIPILLILFFVIVLIMAIFIIPNSSFNLNSSLNTNDTDDITNKDYSINKTSTENANSNTKYVASIKREKFHLESCEWAKKIDNSNKITYNSRELAIKSGKTPCDVCNP